MDNDNNNLNKEHNQLKSFILTSINSINKINGNKESINFKNKKRNRENKETNYNRSVNTFENKFLSFNQFTDKIREEFRLYKSKKKDFFEYNNIQMFTPNKSYSNNNLIFGNNNNNSDNYPKNDIINVINNYNDYNFNNQNNNYNITNNNEKNYIYQTNKKLETKINNNKDVYIDTLNENILYNEINTFPIYKKDKKIIKGIKISLISGIVIIGLVYLTSRENIKIKIKNSLSCLSNSSWLIIFCFVLVFIIVILIYHKKKETFKYNEISHEDFEMLKKLLYENYFRNNDEYIGIFQNQFIKDCSNKRKMDERKYIKYIFPLITKLIEEFNNKNEENKSLYFNNDYNISDFNFAIEEIDLIRDGQKMKLWKFIELSTP